MLTAALTSSYSDYHSLKRMCSSIYELVDYIITIEGKFALHPGIISHDETMEIYREFPNICMQEAQNFHESEKRNLYLDQCKKLKIDFGIIIDSDEYIIEADKKTFYDNLLKLPGKTEILGLKFYNCESGYSYSPRLWSNPGEIRYINHNIWQVENQVKISGFKTENVEGLTIKTSNDDLRSKDWLEGTYQYQLRMFKHENKVRLEHEGIR
jgi:hypothetical protein